MIEAYSRSGHGIGSGLGQLLGWLMVHYPYIGWPVIGLVIVTGIIAAWVDDDD